MTTIDIVRSDGNGARALRRTIVRTSTTVIPSFRSVQLVVSMWDRHKAVDAANDRSVNICQADKDRRGSATNENRDRSDLLSNGLAHATLTAVGDRPAQVLEIRGHLGYDGTLVTTVVEIAITPLGLLAQVEARHNVGAMPPRSAPQLATLLVKKDVVRQGAIEMSAIVLPRTPPQPPRLRHGDAVCGEEVLVQLISRVGLPPRRALTNRETVPDNNTTFDYYRTAFPQRTFTYDQSLGIILHASIHF